MAGLTKERDIVLEGIDNEGNPTIDFPITRLGNLEDTAEEKLAPATGDYIPIIDGSDECRMKKMPAGNVGGGASTAEMAEIRARLKAVEIAMGGEITSNQSALIFDNLSDVIVTEGVWNEANTRLEF